MKKIMNKLCACLVALSMVVSLSSCGNTQTAAVKTAATVSDTALSARYTAKPGSITKTETVYVNMQNDGSLQSISVSDWLHTDVGQVCVDDCSDLSNIQNVKSDVQPIREGEKLQWHMPTTDIYYSGDTDKTPPVAFNIRYYLNGKSVTAREIAGKSGQVKIEVEMQNNASKTVTVNGKKTKIYLPVMVVGGMIMEEGAFNGITVENGRSIGDGSKEIVVLFGMPGMAESLGLDNTDLGDLGGVVISNTASVTAAAEDFELGNIYFAVIPLASLDLGTALPVSSEDLQSTLALLKQVQNAVTALDPNALLAALTADSGSVNSLLNVVTDAVSLYRDNKALLEVMSKYLSGENGRQLAKLLELLGSDETGELLDFLSKHDITKLLDGMQAMDGALPLVNNLAADLNDPAVQQALDNLPETLEKLDDIRGELAKNQELIDSLTALVDSDNAAALSALADTLEQADLASLADKYAPLAENADDLVQRADAWLTFGQNYGLFTKAPAGAETAVTFVYMTPSIKVQAVAAAAPAAAPEQSWWDKFFGNFAK